MCIYIYILHVYIYVGCGRYETFVLNKNTTKSEEAAEYNQNSLRCSSLPDAGKKFAAGRSA